MSIFHIMSKVIFVWIYRYNTGFLNLRRINSPVLFYLL
jgi:hypothetical protein